ncbi:MAG: peptidase M3A and M3B thimet/oligopeptidase F [Acidobacteria bacterium]|nr:MAG: peptidase M3A and M3B thimet/oligopeptidase F [Acidobacteriota bacterium]
MTSEILNYIRQHEATIAPLHKDYGQKVWDLSLSGSEEHEKALVGAKERYLKIYNNRQEFEQIRQWKSSAAQLDPIAARQLKLIHDAFVPNQINEDVLRDLVRRETEIENLFNTFRANFEDSKASDNQLRDVLRNETGITRRRAAWEATKQIGREVAPQLLELIAIRNREARHLGYADYYSMMFELQELDENWVFSLFDRLEQLSERAFSEMKAALDARLKKKYSVADREAYPWLYSDPFFQEFPAGGANESLDEIFRDSNIEALTQAHYDSIGLDIRDLLARSDLYEREGKSQHAFCLDVDHEGDIRVLCNIRKNERWMSTMLHEFGHAVYDKYNDGSLPFFLRTPAHILTTEAIAMLNGRMSKDPEWLVKIGGLSEAAAKRVSASALTTLQAEMLIFLRWAITLVRFERELYRNSAQNLNRLWWEYVERFQKVTPPPDRDQSDWASKNHLATSPVYYQNYVLGELVASQLLRHLYRNVVRRASYAGNPEVGQYLVENVFKPGARYDWNTMLKKATGEELNPEHFVRQFVAGISST